MANTRKTILFIVEGHSDKKALEYIIRKIYSNYKGIEFRVTDGDISSNETVTIENVEDKIYRIIFDFMEDKKLKRSNIFQVIQIFDTDGTYIPENAIISGENKKIEYTETKIVCKDVEKVKTRNIQKSNIMNHLLGQNEIKGFPYKMYYMSCNLDHALYNQQNLDDALKGEMADKFYERFIGKEEMFIDYLKTDVVNGVPDSFLASWRFIKEELHSLERHTNFHIFFQDNPLPGI